MTAPTPDEITTALNTLRRIPDTTGMIAACVEDIERVNHPLTQLTGDLLRWLHTLGLPDAPSELERELKSAVARHGLRITTDPGKLIGFGIVEPFVNGLWGPEGATPFYGLDDLASARSSAQRGEALRVAAVHLLPEGGQQ